MTATGYLAYNFVLSRLPTPTIGLLSAAGPGVGALAAALIFGTTIGPTAALGIAIILTGTALPSLWGAWTERRPARPARRPADPPSTPRADRRGVSTQTPR